MFLKRFFLYAAIGCLLVPQTAYAGEKSKAELIQEMMMSESYPAPAEKPGSEPPVKDEGPVIEGGAVESDGTTAAEQVAMEEDSPIPFNELDDRILALSGKGVNDEGVRDEVLNLRKAYELMPASDKLGVEHYDMLCRAEEIIAEYDASHSVQDPESQSESTGTESTLPDTGDTVQVKADSANTYFARQYKFKISKEDFQPCSLIVHFTTDENGDGKGEVPELLFIGPNGTNIAARSSSGDIMTDSIHAYFDWQKEFLQIDLEYLAPGGWIIQSSVPVTYDRTSYLRPNAVPEAEPVTPQPAVPQPRVLRPSNSRASALLKIAAFFFVFVLILVGLYLFTKRKFIGGGMRYSSKKSKQKHPAGKPDGSAAQEEEDFFEKYKRDIREKVAQEDRQKREAEEERLNGLRHVEDAEDMDDDRIDVTQGSFNDDDGVNLFDSQDDYGDPGTEDHGYKKHPVSSRFG